VTTLLASSVFNHMINPSTVYKWAVDL